MLLGGSAQEQTEAGLAQPGTRWKIYSETLRTKIGLRQTDKPWSSRRGVALRGVPRCPRMVDVIDVAFHISTKPTQEPVSEAEAAKLQTLIVDYSQNLSFKTWGHHVPCLTTSTQIYMYGRDRILVDAERFRVMGFGNVDLSNISPSALRDLSGEAMAVYTISELASAILLQLRFPGLFSSSSRLPP